MHLTLHLTPSCNFRCDYCYAPPHGGEPMSEATAEAALRFAAKHDTNGSCGIVFFGGEPLLRKSLIRWTVARAREIEREQEPLRFHFKVTTNGWLLDPEFLAFAVENEVLVALSFDGRPEAHDRHRRLPDGSPTAAVLLERLHLLLEVRPYAAVLMVVNPDTADCLADSVSFLVEQGVRYLIVSMNYAAPWSAADLRGLRRQYRRLADRYLAWSRAGRKFWVSPFETKIASHVKGAEAVCDRCELGARQLSVDAGGWLYPCVQFTKAGPTSRWCLGHVATGLDEAKRAAIRAESEGEKEPCRDCALQSRCSHTCGCLNWQTTGTVTAVSPALCAHERMLIPIVDRVGQILYRERNPVFLHKHYNASWPVLSLLEDAAL
ncbi:MAG: radical SAM protein [Polyangiaceae bacterium]|nr:radical SAM protein [Polyangiaceae bacterium]